MADYIEPTKTSFNAAEQVAIDAVTQTADNLLTRTGSVIRELIIRPIAYLLSWASGNVDNSIRQYSISYLKTSQLTENPVADLVASNYFVERRQATSAKGIITLTLSSPTLTLAAGSRFTVGGVQVCTEVRYMIQPVPGTDTDTLVYIKAIPSGGSWLANVPVAAVNPGAVEVPVGTPVSLNFSCSYFEAADLTSPITGGSGTETDAELMLRAEYNTAAAGIGTYYGIKKKLSKAPAMVFGMSVIAGEDKPLFRARYNNVNINPGGFVDCHVKTANQAVTKAVTCEATVSDNTFTVQIPSTACPGFIRVASVIAGGVQPVSYSVTYGSDDAAVNAEGARLSDDQNATVTFPTTNIPEGTNSADLYLTYMPAVHELQDYLNQDNEHFIGQDIKVKAAVPVALDIGCSVHCDRELDDDEITGIKQAIVDYVNSTNVGIGYINFSDIRAAVLVSFPDVDLRLPCVITGDVYTKDGNIDTLYSNTGIFDIRNSPNTNYWGYQVCFFSTCLSHVRLNVI